MTTPAVLEPIKTALVDGDNARARRLRYELVRGLLRDTLEKVDDAQMYGECDALAFVWEKELLAMLDSLGIPEENQ